MSVFNACPLLMIVLVLAAGYLAESGICQEGLGSCGSSFSGPSCNDRCRFKHPAGRAEGVCDLTVRTPLCICYFDCPPPNCVADLGFERQYDCCRERCESIYGGLPLNLSCGEEAPDGSCHCRCQYACGYSTKKIKQ